MPLRQSRASISSDCTAWGQGGCRWGGDHVSEGEQGLQGYAGRHRQSPLVAPQTLVTLNPSPHTTHMRSLQTTTTSAPSQTPNPRGTPPTHRHRVGRKLAGHEEAGGRQRGIPRRRSSSSSCIQPIIIQLLLLRSSAGATATTAATPPTLLLLQPSQACCCCATCRRHNCRQRRQRPARQRRGSADSPEQRRRRGGRPRGVAVGVPPTVPADATSTAKLCSHPACEGRMDGKHAAVVVCVCVRECGAPVREQRTLCLLAGGRQRYPPPLSN